MMNIRFNLPRNIALMAMLLFLIAPSNALAQVPTVAAPLPTAHPADAISVFSNAYGNVPVIDYSMPWDDADVVPVSAGGDDALEYTVYSGTTEAAIEMVFPGIDATGMTHFHMDVWTPAAPPESWAIRLVDFGPNQAYGDGTGYPANWPFDDQEVTIPVDLTVGEWTSIDIALDDFVFPGTGDPMTRGSISQIIMLARDMTFYVDNVYFYGPSSPKPSIDVYMVDVKTGDVQQVTSLYDSDEYGAAVSNDGKTIVHDVVTFFPYYTHSLALTDIETGVTTPLADSEGGNDARFSPNGRFIVFDRGGYGDATLYPAQAKGKNAGVVSVLRENARNADWSNDSKRIVFQDVTDGTLRTMNLKDGSETIIAAAGESPAWSRNGKSIAYGLFDGGVPGAAIFVVDVDSKGEPKGVPLQVTDWTPDSYVGQPSWSNNSRTLVYQGNPGSGDFNFDIWTVSARGGTPAVLTGTLENGEYDPAYSNNGRFVVFSAFTDPSVASKGFVRGNGFTDLEADVQPEGFTLEQNYPNPFNPTTAIRFELPADVAVRLTIFDAMGREVSRLIDRPMSAGSHTVNWSAAADMPSGTYFYRLSAGEVVQTRPMTLIK